MRFGWRQASFALASVLVLLIGVVTVLASATQSSAHHVPSQIHTIEIGNEFYEFNPPACVIHRKDSVRWKNVSDEPRRIIVLGTSDREWWELGNWVPLDTGILQPGETSSASGPWAVNGQSVAYFDPTHPEIPDQSFRVTDGGDECGQVTPTPTPTPSPTPSPTPTESPTSSPTPEGYFAIIPDLTRGEAE